MKVKMLTTAVAALALWGSAATASEPTTIVYASYLSPQHITNPVMERFFANARRDSGDTLSFEMHVAGSLLSGRDIPAGVRDGLADAGYFVGAFVPAQMPVDNFIAEFSLLNSDPMAMTGALNELVLFNCPECEQEYRDFNVQFLATYALTPYVYHCREELRTLADFRGKRIRGISVYADLARSLGATPLNVSPDEATEALERGILDCALHSVAAQKARSYGDSAKWVILDPLGGFVGASTFNLRIPKWNSLSPMQRAAIRDNLAEMATDALFNYFEDDQAIIEEYTATGTTFYHAEPEFAEHVARFTEEYMPIAIEKGHAIGLSDPEGLATALLELTERWQALLDEHGRDRETFQALLHSEVFSRIDVDSDR